jgi:transmembrane sensor
VGKVDNVDQTNNTSNLESLMRDVSRAVQGDARRRQLLPEIQARLARLDDQSRQSQRSYGTWRLSLLGAAACAAGVAIFVMRPAPLSFAVDGAGAGRAGAVGERLVAAEAAPLALRFSDGSQVTLPPRAQAQVDAVDANGATVALEEGAVDVSVVHRAKTRWQIRAGRYQIRVTGTKFTAGWDRRTDTLTVTMREGSVEVTGPGLKAPARVVGGQRLRANDVSVDRPGEEPEVRVEDATTAARQVEDAAPGPEPQAVAEPEAPSAAAPPQVAVQKPASAHVRDVDRRGSRARRALPATAAAPLRLAMADAEWRAYERKGQLKEAFWAAMREGDWNDACRQLGERDLVKLGDMARVAGKVEHAELAYRSALRRFPEADDALYRLGKLAFDQQKDYVAAGNVFESYVKRFPRGKLRAEAAGLLLESRLKAGDNARAREAAARYLASFPDGPHAKLARATDRH